MYGSQYAINDLTERWPSSSKDMQKATPQDKIKIQINKVHRKLFSTQKLEELMPKQASDTQIKKATLGAFGPKESSQSKLSDRAQLRREFTKNINDGLIYKAIAPDASLPKSRVVEFGEDEYAEYEPVIGNRVRDLNKARNFAVESMKKNWNLRKASHYKVRD